MLAFRPSEASVFATGLDNPRGMKFGPDKSLYVAEGGTGGENTTVGRCKQVPPPIGPYTGSTKGSRISRFTPDGKRTIVVDGLPSSKTAQPGGFVSGVADVAFIDGNLYAILSGAGCSHGVYELPNSVIAVGSNGKWKQIVDLGNFLENNPTANPDPNDDEYDGTWYSMIAVNGDLYAIEPNHGELDQITKEGRIRRICDISETQGHIIPTALAFGPDGNFYVGNLGKFPAAAACRILKIGLRGNISIHVEGLTTVTGLAFDARGTLYALETSAPVTASGRPVVPGTGRVVRIDNNGALSPVVTGLTFPTALVFGPDDTLYVSNFGFGFPLGKGEVVRFPAEILAT
jgi:hypothetical protein